MSAPGTSIRGGIARGRLAWSAALVGALALGALPAATTAAGPLVRFSAIYNDCGVYGAGPASKLIKITWKDSDGSIKHVQTVKSKANGTFGTTCDRDEQVERGDIFIAKIGTKSRTFTVPRLGLHIDRVTDEIAGKGPESTTLHLSLPDGGDDVTTAGDGSYSYDASGIGDLIGSQWVAVSFETASGDIVYRELQVPFVTVWRGRADIYMKGRPGFTIAVDLMDGPTSLADVDCRVGPTGGCWLQFTDADGHMVRARTGNRVFAPSIGSDADFLIPAVSVKGVTSTDVISGTCLAGQSSPYWFEAYRPAGSGYVFRDGMTTAAGTFSKDVTSKLDLRSGDKIYAQCQLPAGDWVARFITVP